MLRSAPNQHPTTSQFTREPSFHHERPEAFQQPPAIPKASELPMPKLNSQAMNLLSMFKTGPKQPSQEQSAFSSQAQHPRTANVSAVADASPAAILPQAAKNQSEQPPSQARRGSARAQFGSLIPSTVSPVSAAGTAKPKAPSRKQSEVSDKQAGLLSLFKSASTAATPPPAPTTSNTSLDQTQPKQTQSAALLDLFKTQRGNAASSAKTVGEGSVRCSLCSEREVKGMGAAVQLLHLPWSSTVSGQNWVR